MNQFGGQLSWRLSQRLDGRSTRMSKEATCAKCSCAHCKMSQIVTHLDTHTYSVTCTTSPTHALKKKKHTHGQPRLARRHFSWGEGAGQSDVLGMCIIIHIIRIINIIELKKKVPPLSFCDALKGKTLVGGLKGHNIKPTSITEVNLECHYIFFFFKQKKKRQSPTEIPLGEKRDSPTFLSCFFFDWKLWMFLEFSKSQTLYITAKNNHL